MLHLIALTILAIVAPFIVVGLAIALVMLLQEE